MQKEAADNFSIWQCRCLFTVQKVVQDWEKLVARQMELIQSLVFDLGQRHCSQRRMGQMGFEVRRCSRFLLLFKTLAQVCGEKYLLRLKCTAVWARRMLKGEGLCVLWQSFPRRGQTVGYGLQGLLITQVLCVLGWQLLCVLSWHLIPAENQTALPCRTGSGSLSSKPTL